MASILFVLPLLSALTAQQPPQFYILPSSSLADLLVEERSGAGGVLGATRTPCMPSQNGDEIVVCAEREDYRIGPLPRDPPPAPTFTGRQSHASAMEASRCANGCAPQGQIDLIRGVRTLRRGLERIFGGD